MNFAWRVNFLYNDTAGNLLLQYAPLSVDVIAPALPLGPDKSINPDLGAIALVLTANFPPPVAGATVALMGVSTSQAPVIYS